MSDAGHRCRSAKRCVNRTADGSAITVKQNTLCPACVKQIQAQADELPALRDAVRVFIGIRPKTAMESRVSGTQEPSSPINLSAETLIGDIDDVLSWVGGVLIRDLVTQAESEFLVWVGEVQQRVLWDGVARALKVGKVWARAHHLLGFERQWERRHAPCGECGMPCMGTFVGSGTVHCTNCGVSIAQDKYEAICVAKLKGE